MTSNADRRSTNLARPRSRSLGTHLFSLTGTIDRVPFGLIGLVAAALKFAIDSYLVGLTGRFLSFFDYWTSPVLWFVEIWISSYHDVRIALGLLAVATFFVWLGMSLLIKRLRAVAWPLSLSLLFFFPVLNVLLFLGLCLLPAKTMSVENGALGRQPPTADEESTRAWLLDLGFWGAAFAGALAGVLMGLACFFAVAPLGVGLFLGSPFVIGLVSSRLDARSKLRTMGRSQRVAAFSVVLACVMVLVLAFEGLLCLVMASPFGFGLAALGAALGNQLARHRTRPGFATLCLFMVTPPSFLAYEVVNPPTAPLYEVTSSVIVDAPASVVWQNVVEFPPIPEPDEWYFRLGIAYPREAVIDGSGVGAVRLCRFSTGDFVEPIEVWREPKLLRFGIRHSPPPLAELSPYEHISPPHLDGFLRSERGQFELIDLGDGRTRLTGTSWYRHDLFPSEYWRLWSDAIIHRIHFRVLRHIRELSETTPVGEQS